MTSSTPSSDAHSPERSSQNAAYDPVPDPDTLELLRAATATMRELPRLLKVVRSTYRAQHRKPQFEPAYVSYIERYVRFYHSKPLGMLDATHVRAYLTHVARRPGMTPEKQDLIREALLFFHNEVLQQDLDDPDDVADYVRATGTEDVERSRSVPEPSRSFWEMAAGNGAE